MHLRAAKGILLAAFLAGVMPAASHAADAVKAGNWQFTTQMELPAMPQSTAGTQPGQAGGQSMTRTACIDPAHPIPVEQQCKLDNMTRRADTVAWTMTCNTPRGPVQSTGSARYAGNSMTATLTARIPGPDAKPVNAPGTITGRYLGPCEAK